jgi:glycosyltransferase involved in cell wall biosynthesis
MDTIAGFCLTKVTFTGYLQQQTLYDWYRIADMGVHPSFHEEFGYVPVEMMMHALPVIVTDTGSLSEIVDDGVDGLKIPFRRIKQKRMPDTEALCDRMKWILEHPDKAKRLGRNARKKFLKTYKLSNWGEKMLTLYRELYSIQNNNTI